MSHNNDLQIKHDLYIYYLERKESGNIFTAIISVPVAQWLEHCVSSAKDCEFNPQCSTYANKKYIT